ncbi:MAG TPA: cell division protein FtsX [Propionibacteriaceae bacterium]|nr:cell division protein FtsX [Propionibacteriaceae bacterium]
MSVLQRALRRDLKSRAAQFVAVGVTVVLCVAMFGATFDAFANLTASYQGMYTRYAMADLISVGGDTSAIASQGRKQAGVAHADTRAVGETAMRVDGHRQLARIVGMPPDGEPSVNQVMVLSGSNLDPTRNDQVLVEQHLAGARQLVPGDVIEVATNTGWEALTVAGIVASPEYLWPARSRQEAIVPFDQWGVLFANEKVVATLPVTEVQHEAMFVYTDNPPANLDQRLHDLALGLGAVSTQTLADQPSEATLSEDLNGFGEMSVAFPLMFLVAAGLGLAVVLGRMIAQQRGQIGVLRANGFSRRTVRRHYVAYGYIIGTAGSVIGVVLGSLSAASITRLYTAAISVPVTVVEVRPTTIIAGLLMGPLAGVIAAWLPARRAAAVSPAQVMRGEVTVSVGHRSLVERLIPPLRRLPIRWRSALRGLGRSPRRTLSTIVGVTIATTLVLVSWGMIDTVQILLQRQFVDVQHQDAQVAFLAPIPADKVSSTVSVTGVAKAEPELDASVAIVNGDNRYATSLVGLRTDTTMHSFLSPDGVHLTLPEHGLLLGSSLRKLLDVRVGDTVTVDAGGGRIVSEKVAGFVDEPLGTFGYASLATVADLTGVDAANPPVSTALVTFTPGADRTAVIDRLNAVTGVAAVMDAHALYDLAQSMMGLFYAFVGVMVVLGAIMAFALIFTTMTTNVSERSVELAALRTLGMPQGRVSRLITAENLLLVTAGLVPGLILGSYGAAAAMASFSSDLFQFNLQMRPTTVLFTALAILAVGWLSQWPAVRSIGRIDLATVVRERAS